VCIAILWPIVRAISEVVGFPKNSATYEDYEKDYGDKYYGNLNLSDDVSGIQ